MAQNEGFTGDQESRASKVQFADGTTLNIVAVRGSMEFIQNANRDALTFEVDPGTTSVGELISIFQDENKTRELVLLNEGDEIIGTAGVNYTLYISAGNQMREEIVSGAEYGEVAQRQINFAKVAQITHTEYLLKQILAGR